MVYSLMVLLTFKTEFLILGSVVLPLNYLLCGSRAHKKLIVVQHLRLFMPLLYLNTPVFY